MLFVMYRRINGHWEPVGYTWDSELECDITNLIIRRNGTHLFYTASVCPEADVSELPELTWEKAKKLIF